MGIPTPNKNETRSDFMTRCVNDLVLKENYKSSKERYRVCAMQLNTKKNKSQKTNNLLNKQKMTNFKVGDRVSWEASSGESKGVIRKIVNEDFTIPDSEVIVKGSPQDPAYVIETVKKLDDDIYQPTGSIVGHLKKALRKESFSLKNTLVKEWQLYKKGLTDQPKVKFTASIKNASGNFIATLTKEVLDRDGEVVVVDGIALPKKNRVPLVNSHETHRNIVENVLGKVIDITKVKQNGVSALQGTLEFAPTPYGQIAKVLVEGSFIDSVSIGFGVTEYDVATKTISASELYETSLVAVPSNPEALITRNDSLKSQQEDLTAIEKSLSHYKTIKPAWQEMKKTFLSDTFTQEIEYQKTGDILIDINNIYELVLSQHKAAKVKTSQAAQKTSVQTQAQKTSADNISIDKEQLSYIITKLFKSKVST